MHVLGKPDAVLAHVFIQASRHPVNRLVRPGRGVGMLRKRAGHQTQITHIADMHVVDIARQAAVYVPDIRAVEPVTKKGYLRAQKFLLRCGEFACSHQRIEEVSQPRTVTHQIELIGIVFKGAHILGNTIGRVHHMLHQVAATDLDPNIVITPVVSIHRAFDTGHTA